MMAESSRDPLAALNEVLSEVIDVVMALRQAHRRVPEGHELHAELDQLLDADTDRGVSALAYMPSVAGRQVPNLWHGPVGDDDVSRVVVEQLDRLEGHVRANLAEQEDEHLREPLERINAELQVHLDALNEQ